MQVPLNTNETMYVSSTEGEEEEEEEEGTATHGPRAPCLQTLKILF
jgi:hypothetical protein